MRLEITVEDPVLVAEGGALQKLVHEAPDGYRVKGPTIAVHVYILLQIPLAVLEDEDQLGLGVYDIVEADDINVLELLHERDLTDSCRWSALFRIEMNLLKGHDLVCCP